MLPINHKSPKLRKLRLVAGLLELTDTGLFETTWTLESRGLGESLSFVAWNQWISINDLSVRCLVRMLVSEKHGLLVSLRGRLLLVQTGKLFGIGAPLGG